MTRTERELLMAKERIALLQAEVLLALEQRDEARAEAVRWAARVKLLEARANHAATVLRAEKFR